MTKIFSGWLEIEYHSNDEVNGKYKSKVLICNIGKTHILHLNVDICGYIYIVNWRQQIKQSVKL